MAVAHSPIQDSYQQTYHLRVSVGTTVRARRLRRLYRLGTGQTMSMAGWFEQFIWDALQRQETYLRNNGIPIPPDEDDVAAPAGEKFTGLVDDSPAVDE